jgi:hypothetical protein
LRFCVKYLLYISALHGEFRILHKQDTRMYVCIGQTHLTQALHVRYFRPWPFCGARGGAVG